MNLIDLPDIRQQVRQLQTEQGFITAEGPTQVDTVPTGKPAQAKLLRDLSGKWAISRNPYLMALLIGAGWTHRGLLGADLYWQR